MLDLLDYRRRVADMYRAVRENADDPAAVCAAFRREKDALFREHPQSALDTTQKATFNGLAYYDYDPAFRVVATLDTSVESETFQVDLGADGRFSYRRFGRVTVALPTGTATLCVYWIEGYGGGAFLPFKDATNNETTYGGGRYLYDTIKGADLGTDFEARAMILDFNYAYHPSCTYNPRWMCPLSPPENTLPFPIPAGERLMAK
jgi:uncharacterized protein (DUF1684 family)